MSTPSGASSIPCCLALVFHSLYIGDKRSWTKAFFLATRLAAAAPISVLASFLTKPSVTLNKLSSAVSIFFCRCAWRASSNLVLVSVSFAIALGTVKPSGKLGSTFNNSRYSCCLISNSSIASEMFFLNWASPPSP